MRALYCLPALALLAGCATTGAKTPGDPYEGFNRKMWSVDETLDKHILRPVAKGYIAVVPTQARRGLSNALENVTEPFSFINSLLQAKPKRALNSLGRFVINSTVGIGGLFDVAGKNGYKQTPEDLGQTFAVWGARKSTYLVLPLYGPTTLRDGVGTVASEWVDPYRILIRKELSFWPATGLTAFEFVDARANLIDSGADTLLDSSADSYAVARSAYLQHRNAEIDDQDDAGAAGSGDAALNAALDDLGPDDSSGSGAQPVPQKGGTAEQPGGAPGAVIPGESQSPSARHPATTPPEKPATDGESQQ